MGLVRLALKTINGELLHVDVPSDVTIEQLRQHLIQHLNYSSAVQLMFGSALVDPTRYADEFPHGSLMIVGNKRRTTPNTTPQRSTVSPQSASRVHVHQHHHQPASHHPHHQQPQHAPATPSKQQQHPQQPPQGEATPQSATPQSRSPRGLSLTVVIPLSDKSFELQLPGDATMNDLLTACVAEDPTTAGCRIMCKGKVLDVRDRPLHSSGVRSGNVVYLATGILTDLQLFKLFQARREFETTKRLVAEGGESLSEQDRKGYYEQLMKVLLSTDELMDLEGEWKLKRKELVKEITAFQDSMNSQQRK